ncbi:MAG: hypothetical protein J5935_00480 [Lachnospiraceae bacterium]|nr:hypothetical protein [Lachnospiraceae bacterium]
MDNANLTFVLTILGLILLFYFLGRAEQRRQLQRQLRLLKYSFGVSPAKKVSLERFQLIPRYFEKHRLKNQLDDITWDDLDMDEIYTRIDRTHSAAGEEYLYFLLRTPLPDGADPLLDEAAVSYFEDPSHEQERLRLEMCFARAGRSDKYSLYDYLDHLDTLGERPLMKHLPFLILPVLALLLMFASSQAVLLLIAVFAFSLISYYPEKRKIEPYIVSFRYLLRLMNSADEIVKTEDGSVFAKEKQILREKTKALSSFRRGSFLLSRGDGFASGNPFDFLLDYLLIFFHIDLLKFDQMLREVRNKDGDIDALVTALGKMDTTISVSSFRRSLPYYCRPRFDASRIFLEEEELYHPLLKAPVPNSFRTTNSMLITGSNASGKSTFLRAVAISCILAQTLHTVCARDYCANRFRVFSAMSLNDDLLKGESYFMVEIKAIKRILDAAKEESPYPVLCFVDEVLRGTNTIERIAASTEILKTMGEEKLLCFAATHDLELTKMLDGLYTNVHFTEEMAGEDITFPYKLQEGPAVSRNAILLLQNMGYEKDIVTGARNRAEHFEESGVWAL